MFRVLTGVGVLLFGFWIVYMGVKDEVITPVLIGIGFVIVGLVIVFNKREDEIEEIKNDKKA